MDDSQGKTDQSIGIHRTPGEVCGGTYDDSTRFPSMQPHCQRCSPCTRPRPSCKRESAGGLPWPIVVSPGEGKAAATSRCWMVHRERSSMTASTIGWSFSLFFVGCSSFCCGSDVATTSSRVVSRGSSIVYRKLSRWAIHATQRSRFTTPPATKLFLKFSLPCRRHGLARLWRSTRSARVLFRTLSPAQTCISSQCGEVRQMALRASCRTQLEVRVVLTSADVWRVAGREGQLLVGYLSIGLPAPHLRTSLGLCNGDQSATCRTPWGRELGVRLLLLLLCLVLLCLSCLLRTYASSRVGLSGEHSRGGVTYTYKGVSLRPSPQQEALNPISPPPP